MNLRPSIAAAPAALALLLACGAPPSPGPDAGPPDSGVPDSGVPDSGVPDAGTPDAGPPDGGAVALCAGRPCSEGWTVFTQPVFPSVTDISTTARDNVWVLWWDLGTQTYTSHWDGGTWDTVPVNTAATGLADSDAIWTGGQDVAFLAGRSGSSADPYAPRSLRFDAGVWELLPVSGVAGEPLLDVWGTAPTDLWTVGYDHFLHGDGSQWTPVPAPLPARYTLSHIHGTAPDNVWTVGIPYLGTGLTALRLDGGTWEDVSPPAGGENYPEDLWVAGPDEAWIVAQGSSTNWMLHRQAGAWTTVDISTGVHAVWGAAPDDVWFAGEGGLSHWDGRQASPVDLSSLDAGTLWGLAGSGPDDVWAWGPNAVLHFQR